MNNTQLVQDVHDGKESAVKAWDNLYDQLIEIQRCLESIQPLVEYEKNQQHVTD